MRVVSTNQNLNKNNNFIASTKILNNTAFKGDETEVIQNALKLLTTKEANEYLNSCQGQKFVKNLFHNTRVKDLGFIDILEKAFETKKEYDQKFNEMVHYLAENDIGRTFMQT